MHFSAVTRGAHVPPGRDPAAHRHRVSLPDIYPDSGWIMHFRGAPPRGTHPAPGRERYSVREAPDGAASRKETGPAVTAPTTTTTATATRLPIGTAGAPGHDKFPVRSYPLTYNGHAYHFCSRPCRQIWWEDRDTLYRPTVIERLLGGEIQPPTVAGILAWMGLTPEVRGEDAYGYRIVARHPLIGPPEAEDLILSYARHATSNPLSRPTKAGVSRTVSLSGAGNASFYWTSRRRPRRERCGAFVDCLTVRRGGTGSRAWPPARPGAAWPSPPRARTPGAATSW